MNSSKGDWPTAIQHYTEALKRDPNNAVLYSNRAACFIKLMEFQMAIGDCDKCIEKDPKNVKGYIRKGAALTAIHEAGRAARAYEEAMRLDPKNEEARQGYILASRSSNANPEEKRKQAMNDPEIQAILGDPGMRLILEQMSNDPKSAQEHLKNEEVREKLMKLVDAGIVQMR
jgi:stress-induced-phosphoprotein 1